MHTVPIELPWTHLRQIDVPHVIGLLGQADSGNLAVAIWSVKQAQVNRCRILRKESKIDSGPVPRTPLRIWIAWPDLHNTFPCMISLLMCHNSSLDQEDDHGRG